MGVTANDALNMLYSLEGLAPPEDPAAEVFHQ
jgi:hypothetical protein